MPRVSRTPAAVLETDELDPQPQPLAQPEPPAPPPPPPAIAAAPGEAAEDPGKRLSVFELMEKLPEAEWSDHVCYIYRRSNVISKTDNNAKKYLTKVKFLVDEEWIKTNYGGGRFEIFFKNMKSGTILRQEMVEIEGGPILDKDEQLLAPKPDLAAATPAPSTPQAIELELAQLRRELQDARERRDTDPDKIISASERMIELSRKLNPVTAPPKDELTRLRETISLIRDLGGEREKPRSLAQQLEEIKVVAETLGFKPATGAASDAADWRVLLTQNAPQILNEFTKILERWDQHTIQMARIGAGQYAARAPQRPAAPVTAPPAAPAPVQVMPPVEPAQPEPAAEAAMPAGGFPDFDAIKRQLVRLYKKEHTGYAVALVLKESYADYIGLFAQAFGNAGDLKAFAREDAILSEIAADPGFDEFIADFITEMQAEAKAEAMPA